MTTVPVQLESRPEGVPEGSAAADLLATDLGHLRRLVDGARDADVDRALGRSRRSL